MTKKYTQEALLTPEELRGKLNTQISWIYSKSRQKGPDAIPVIRVGKYLRFRLSEVLDWLEQQNKERNNG